MIRFKGYHGPHLKRMTNDEILNRIGKSYSITVLGSVDVFKNAKTGEKVFVCSRLTTTSAFPKYYFDRDLTTTKELKIYFIDQESFEYFREFRNVKEKLPEDGIYERVWYNGNPVIAKIGDNCLATSSLVVIAKIGD